MGAACGYTPEQVGAMSVWQYGAAVAGVLRSKGEGAEDMSQESEDALWRLLEERYVH